MRRYRAAIVGHRENEVYRESVLRARTTTEIELWVPVSFEPGNQDLVSHPPVDTHDVILAIWRYCTTELPELAYQERGGTRGYLIGEQVLQLMKGPRKIPVKAATY